MNAITTYKKAKEFFEENIKSEIKIPEYEKFHIWNEEKNETLLTYEEENDDIYVYIKYSSDGFNKKINLFARMRNYKKDYHISTDIDIYL